MDSPPKFYKTRGKCEQGPIRHIHRNIEFNNVKKKNKNNLPQGAAALWLYQLMNTKHSPDMKGINWTSDEILAHSSKYH